jgi:flagellar protein FliL
MVAPRSDPGRGTEEKHPRESRPEAAPTVPAPQESRWQAWLPLGAALIVMPLLAYVITSFVLVPHLRKALLPSKAVSADAARAPRPEADANSEKDVLLPQGNKQSAALNKLIVNVAGTMGSRYLLTSMTLIGDATDFPARVTEHEPQLRDMASGILNTKTIADLEKPGARNLIRGELLAGFNTILGKSSIQEIYFTEFAIQ